MMHFPCKLFCSGFNKCTAPCKTFLNISAGCNKLAMGISLERPAILAWQVVFKQLLPALLKPAKAAVILSLQPR